jgi:hypothetical protein
MKIFLRIFFFVAITLVSASAASAQQVWEGNCRWPTAQKAQPERLDPVTKACPKRCVLSDRPLLIGGSMETGSYILVGTAAGEQTFD